MLSRRYSSSLLFFCLSVFSASGAGAATGAAVWTRTEWNGEKAWESTQGRVRAVVSEARCRLVYLGAADGSLNLLNAPESAPAPDAKTVSPNWGGHRFWLGPQKRWVWPPLGEWEHAPAASVREDAGVLILEHARIDKSYPAVTREYAWEGGRLRCTARWLDDGRPYFGMHVVAVDTPFSVTARLLKWEEVPQGIVDVQMKAPKADGLLPNPAIEVDGDRATVVAGRTVVKCGFIPQALEIRRPGGWTLAVLPGPHEGVAITSPDFGYLSQVWVGGPAETLSELEQLTPYLAGDAKGRCSSTIYIEAKSPGVAGAKE